MKPLQKEVKNHLAFLEIYSGLRITVENGSELFCNDFMVVHSPPNIRVSLSVII